MANMTIIGWRALGAYLALVSMAALPSAAQAATASANLTIGVTPALTLSPNSLTFPSQTVGVPSVPQTVTVTNSSAYTVILSSVGFSGGNAGDFSQGAGSNCSGSLAASASCHVNVIYTPSTGNTETASLAIVSTSNVTYAAALTGTSTSSVPAYYVATTGSDSNPGTLASPFAALSLLASRGERRPVQRPAPVVLGDLDPVIFL
jgi:hypothetical protein